MYEVHLMLRNSPIARGNNHYYAHELAQRARSRLQRIPYAAVRRLSCDCHGGVLVLRGILPSFYYKQLAQEAVGGIDGVTQIVNEVEVVTR
jgi:hypothetical protein